MRYSIALLIFIFFGCVERFDPDIDETEERQLVIEGMITDQLESYTVIISRTRNVSEANASILVAGADVSIEDDQGNSIKLTEVSLGTYSSNNGEMVGQIGKSYRLSVNIGEQEYLSSYERIMPSLPIDSIYNISEFVQNQDALGDITTELLTNVFVDATVEPDKSFYRYDWEGIYTAQVPNQGSTECWEDPEDFPFREAESSLTCYITDKSERVISTLGSEGLSASTFERHQVASFSPIRRFQGRYSIEISQFSLTKEAFSFWQSIENQTSANGGLFDPPPSEIPGNIFNANDPDEIVLGYFSASAVAKKRAFLDTNTEVILDHYISNCTPPVDPLLGTVVGLRPIFCCDCRLLLNSSTTKPDFWP